METHRNQYLGPPTNGKILSGLWVPGSPTGALHRSRLTNAEGVRHWPSQEGTPATGNGEQGAGAMGQQHGSTLGLKKNLGVHFAPGPPDA